MLISRKNIPIPIVLCLDISIHLNIQSIQSFFLYLKSTSVLCFLALQNGATRRKKVYSRVIFN